MILTLVGCVSTAWIGGGEVTIEATGLPEGREDRRWVIPGLEREPAAAVREIENEGYPSCDDASFAWMLTRNGEPEELRVCGDGLVLAARFGEVGAYPATLSDWTLVYYLEGAAEWTTSVADGGEARATGTAEGSFSTAVAEWFEPANSCADDSGGRVRPEFTLTMNWSLNEGSRSIIRRSVVDP